MSLGKIGYRWAIHWSQPCPSRLTKNSWLLCTTALRGYTWLLLGRTLPFGDAITLLEFLHWGLTFFCLHSSLLGIGFFICFSSTGEIVWVDLTPPYTPKFQNDSTSKLSGFTAHGEHEDLRFVPVWYFWTWKGLMRVPFLQKVRTLWYFCLKGQPNTAGLRLRQKEWDGCCPSSLSMALWRWILMN
jgi:hypothetical protein